MSWLCHWVFLIVLWMGLSGCDGSAAPPRKTPKQDNSKVSVEELSIDGSVSDKTSIRVRAKSLIEVRAKLHLVTEIATAKINELTPHMGLPEGDIAKIGSGTFTDSSRALTIVASAKATNLAGQVVTSIVPCRFSFHKDGRTMEMLAYFVVPDKKGRHSFVVWYSDELNSVVQPNGIITQASKNPQTAIIVSTIEVTE